MTLPPSLSALCERLGLDPNELLGADCARAEAALTDATALAMAEVSARTASLWAAGAAPRVVELVVLTAARRGYENPRGILTEALGEHSLSMTSSEAVGVYLTTREAATLRRAAGIRGVGTIRTHSAYKVPE